MNIGNTITSRQSKIMHAIVREYITKGDPVSSHLLMEESDLSISSATIRKEMSILEQMGFLISPHTSAGRVPTDISIQYYVDELVNLYCITLSEKARLEEYYEQAKWQLDQTLTKNSSASFFKFK